MRRSAAGQAPVAIGDGAGVVAAELDDHPAVAVRPVGVVVVAFGQEGDAGHEAERRDEKRAPVLTFSDSARSVWLYHGNCFELLDAIAAKHPEGRFDCIFADPPYFLSNGGITCHAGRMVKVDKGDWDKSQGADENHNFNREWLARCQRVLKPNGTIWVSGTHHVIFSIGFAMQQLGFKILNDIAWEKPNPPPNRQAVLPHLPLRNNRCDHLGAIRRISTSYHPTGH